MPLPLPATPEPDEDENVGGLAMLPDMPLDVLHEIFGHLEPYDLLRLSRTTRTLRAVLLGRRSRDIWKSSFERMTEREGYPPCPDDMCEPAYANLMFSYHCHECNHEPDSYGPILFMFMEARTQLCSGCAGTKFIFKYTLHALLCEWAGLSFPQDWNSELNLACERLLKLVPTTIDAFHAGQNYVPFGEKYHLDTLRSLWSEWQELTGQEAKEAWFKAQEERRNKIVSHAELCDDYMEGRLAREAADALAESTNEQRMKAARVERVKDCLVSLGWGREVNDLCQPYRPLYLEKDFYKPFHRQSAVVRLSELSDRQCNAALQDPSFLQPIVEWLGDVRRRRHEREKLEKIRARVKKWVEPLYRDFVLSYKSPGDSMETEDDSSTPEISSDATVFLTFPCIAEICQLEEFKAPLEGTPFFHDTGLDEAQEDTSQFSDDTWAAGRHALPAFVESWRAKQIQDLLDVIRNSHANDSLKAALEGTGDFDESVLPLAVAVFKCKQCEDSLVYPRIFNHACLYPQLSGLGKTKTTTEPALPSTSRSTKTRGSKGKGKQADAQPTLPQTSLLRKALSQQRVWDAGHLEFHDAAFQHLLVAFELHDIPPTITMDAMKERNLWFKGTCTCFIGELQFPSASDRNTRPDDVLQLNDMITKSQPHKKREAYAGSLEIPPVQVVRALEKRNAKAKAKRNTPKPERSWAPCFLCPDHRSVGHLSRDHGFDKADARWYESVSGGYL
ncbi:hypothetical protein BKA70DRAFT_1249522 [Coprinopsis sp. MPI-PUGE-AT-0042]|nr:hypothetical protein BKA70DRAFT_1249522 [Coprinopsis sp. MPI-PUGE-AT-0042]